jgi:hypothetical protein
MRQAMSEKSVPLRPAVHRFLHRFDVAALDELMKETVIDRLFIDPGLKLSPRFSSIIVLPQFFCCSQSRRSSRAAASATLSVTLSAISVAARRMSSTSASAAIRSRRRRFPSTIPQRLRDCGAQSRPAHRRFFFK